MNVTLTGPPSGIQCKLAQVRLAHVSISVHITEQKQIRQSDGSNPPKLVGFIKVNRKIEDKTKTKNTLPIFKGGVEAVHRGFGARHWSIPTVAELAGITATLRNSFASATGP